MGPTKLNHRLLKAYLASFLAKDPNCRLVFVGENHGGDYGKGLLDTIKQSNLSERIKITGWVDSQTYRDYLASCDIAVQLRTQSRGETSGTVLDCMNHGIATIVNAHGSLAEIPQDAVWMLADEFTDEELIEALETLYKDIDKRKKLGKKAQEVIKERHDPHFCAKRYYEAIEEFYSTRQKNPQLLISQLVGAIADLPSKDLVDDYSYLARVAEAISANIPQTITRKQLLVDISELVQRDVKTGIQRVTRSILKELLSNPPKGYRVEPVYATADKPGYFYARRFTMRFLNCPDNTLSDEPIDFQTGDIFLG
ncbi:MAG: glycosyltransferase family 4 protein, partial [Dissulfurimicrobium sp.]|uniref:glycosyltransferase family 4 protein n=1 Tax=Dissulfurimicrobium sp. TaxID=2022436 RepID=UPI00404AFA32